MAAITDVPAREPQTIITAIEPEAGRLTVDWADGHRSRFHAVWLRDNCWCVDCRDRGSDQKRFEVADLPDDLSLKSASLSPDGDLEIEWSGDRHRSHYETTWLRRHCYSAGERRARRHRPILWDAGIANRLPDIEYDDALSGEEAQYRLLKMLCDYGFAFVRNVPLVKTSVEVIAGLVGFARINEYGRYWDVVSVPNPDNLAMSSEALHLHTDDPYRYWPAGPNMLHCMEANLSGGESLLIDAFNAAEILRREEPAAFDILTRVRHRFRFHDDAMDLRADGSTIAVDDDGTIVGVRFNERTVMTLDAPEDMVEPFYDAYRRFNLILRRPELLVRFKLQPGDLWLIENHRVMHGRTAFDNQAGRRTLRGCYMDRDGFHSLLRTLARRLGKPEADMVLPGGAIA